MNTPSLRERVCYALVVFFCLAVSLLVGWSSYAARINHSFYDLYFRQRGPSAPEQDTVIVAIDDATLARYGSLPLSRSLLAQGIQAIRKAQPSLIAIDLLLTDVSTPQADHDLEFALDGGPPVVLSAALEASSGSRWLLPLPQFARSAAAIGHVHADPDADGVSRQVLLEKHADGQRYWALALECDRLLARPNPGGDSRGPALDAITEADDGLEVPGSIPHWVPSSREEHRRMLINYAGDTGTFPEVSFAGLLADPSLAAKLRNKVVLLGVTAQATGDRLFTPFSAGAGMPGVEIHANILHTLRSGDYLQAAGNLGVVLVVFAIGALTAAVLGRFHGAALVALLVGVGCAVLAAPYWLFLHGRVWPAFSLFLPFGTTLLVCGPYQLLAARRKFSESESKRRRSQQQFEMATHEIRTPLTAIQASSELLSRYPLDESRRQQMLELIYDESQRLGKLVERFLSVERLAAGELELRRVPVNLSLLLETTAGRLLTAARKKDIRLTRDDSIAEMEIEGDPELLEFAVSNLLTNAVKYSPAGSSVRLALEQSGQCVQIHISDSGAGMTPEESRRIFDRFYRTESAERSAAPGFGLGLAIAREIARQHGGDLALVTRPGAGSRFTISLPVKTSAESRRQATR